ncbi:hypothetical protein MY11210_000509 [Beauveria gryllotalpidicola]
MSIFDFYSMHRALDHAWVCRQHLQAPNLASTGAPHCERNIPDNRLKLHTSSNAQQASNWVWSDEYQNWFQDNGDGTFTWAESEYHSADTGKGKKKGKGKK